MLEGLWGFRPCCSRTTEQCFNWQWDCQRGNFDKAKGNNKIYFEIYYSAVNNCRKLKDLNLKMTTWLCADTLKKNLPSLFPLVKLNFSMPFLLDSHLLVRYEKFVPLFPKLNIVLIIVR